ncbi:MAG TPA: L-threonylcarbamoyladenylate synthase [Burkholderiales bacterium]|nr:L-threonylcarbamoyladenylate synthase [Burkholderiales bacterium]
MSQYFEVHPTHPQQRLLSQAAEIVRDGGVIAYPTDSCYALGCHIGDKDAMAKLRRIRGLDERHHFTLMCRDLSELAAFARTDNAQYRLLKKLTPGPYTFILEGTRELPRRILHPRRKTIGVRIPDHPIVQGLMRELDEPLLSTTLILPEQEGPIEDPQVIRRLLEHELDLIIDAGPCGAHMTTVVDLTGNAVEIVREGKGAIAPLAH